MSLGPGVLRKASASDIYQRGSCRPACPAASVTGPTRAHVPGAVRTARVRSQSRPSATTVAGSPAAVGQDSCRANRCAPFRAVTRSPLQRAPRFGSPGRSAVESHTNPPTHVPDQPRPPSHPSKRMNRIRPNTRGVKPNPRDPLHDSSFTPAKHSLSTTPPTTSSSKPSSARRLLRLRRRLFLEAAAAPYATQESIETNQPRGGGEDTTFKGSLFHTLDLSGGWSLMDDD